MPSYCVRVPIAGYVEYHVDATDPEDAKQGVLEGCGDVFDSPEYEEDTDSNNWEVELDS